MAHSNKSVPSGPVFKTAMIVDIDGTVADCTHRRHLVESMVPSDKNWAAFISPELAAKDSLIEPVAKVIKAIVDGFAGALDVFYVSGRGAESWEVTKAWLELNGLWFDNGTQLWCRGIGDTRCDTVFKKECLDKIQMTHSVLCAFDDRNKVVAMWRSNGIQCFQVDLADF